MDPDALGLPMKTPTRTKTRAAAPGRFLPVVKPGSARPSKTHIAQLGESAPPVTSRVRRRSRKVHQVRTDAPLWHPRFLSRLLGCLR